MSTVLEPAASLPLLVSLLHPFVPSPSSFVSSALAAIGDASKPNLASAFLSPSTLDSLLNHAVTSSPSSATQDDLKNCEKLLAQAGANDNDDREATLSGADLAGAMGIVFAMLDGDGAASIAERLSQGKSESAALRLQLLTTLFNVSPTTSRSLILPHLLPTFSAAASTSTTPPSASAVAVLTATVLSSASLTTDVSSKRSLFLTAHTSLDSVLPPSSGGEGNFLVRYLDTFSAAEATNEVKKLARKAVGWSIRKRISRGAGDDTNAAAQLKGVYSLAVVNSMSSWDADLWRLGGLFTLGGTGGRFGGEGGDILTTVAAAVKSIGDLEELLGGEIKTAEVVETGKLLAVQNLKDRSMSLDYDSLMKALDVGSVVALEGLLVTAIARGFLPKGTRMNQLEGKVSTGTISGGAGWQGDWGELADRFERVKDVIGQ